MNEKNLIPKLSVFALFLFLLSIWTYLVQHRKPTDLVLGQEFLPGLDVEKVSKIVIEGDSGKNKLVLTRQANHFVLENFNEYLLDTEKINDFMYRVSSITVATKAKSSKDYQDQVKVGEKKYENKLTFFDGKGDKLTEFYIGDSGKPKGQYLRMANKEDVYLSEDFLHFSSDKDQFINKELIKVSDKNLSLVELKNPQEEIKIVRENESFKLVEPLQVATNADENKIKSFISHLNSISFDDFLPQTDDRLKDLDFNQIMRIVLQDDTSYLLKTAQKDSKYYISLKMDLKDMPQEVEIDQNDQPDQLKKVEQIIKKSTTAKEFNQRHGSWVYTVSKYVFDNLFKNSKEFSKN